MKLFFSIPMGNNVCYHSSLCFKYSNYNIIDVDQVCYIVVTKFHDHLYSAQYFFYKTKSIGFFETNALKEMYGAIQKLLQKNLYDV